MGFSGFNQSRRSVQEAAAGEDVRPGDDPELLWVGRNDGAGVVVVVGRELNAAPVKGHLARKLKGIGRRPLSLGLSSETAADVRSLFHILKSWPTFSSSFDALKSDMKDTK